MISLSHVNRALTGYTLTVIVPGYISETVLRRRGISTAVAKRPDVGMLRGGYKIHGFLEKKQVKNLSLQRRTKGYYFCMDRGV